MNKKLLWILIILGVVIILLIVLKKAGALGKDEGIKVSAEKAEKRNITEIVTASGKVYPETEVKISPDISGEIVELKVMEGDSVRKGQELAKIYADIYTTQRDQAAAQLNQQEAVASNSAAQLPGLKATLDQAQKAYDREKQLLADKVISQSEFDQAESTLRSAQANYNAAQQSIIGNQAGAASAKANLSVAAKNLSRATIYSPINGVVSLLSVKKGERVVGNSMMAGTEMMRVADMNRIEAIVDVGENDIPKVHLGDSANIEVDAYNNRKFRGIVTQIASSISTTSGSSTTTVSTNDVTNYKVHIRLSPESYKDLINPAIPKSFPFRPGMSASADIETNMHPNVISVPINAVTTREKNTDNAVNNTKQSGGDKKKDNNDDAKASLSSDLDEVVFVHNTDGTVKKVKVKTSIQDINYIEITDGLKVGDEVITGPYSTVSKELRDGMKVQVVPKEKLFEIKKN
ncbi:MAG: efflux RND transporter periplasmic adaptor subunit [Bacteroidetes bacterium]|nr:efflux RND transporter periplasmic adaptor subunit [Bacteroidota bacterium]MBS1933253.1 efflux RND transporter periplasmic adaptor subunit [Bacteroidota bacterium]